jgi:hypothetical protein
MFPNHTNGLGMVSVLAQGYPGYDGIITTRSAQASESWRAYTIG